jgi:hypothetical protein
LRITSGPLAAIAELDLNIVGFVVAGMFVVAWALAIGIWHFGRIEQRWAAGRLSRTTVGQIPSGASTDARNGGRWPQSW